MNRLPDFEARPWPTRMQLPLLRAALATDGLAERHFREWIKLVGFDGPIDEASFRLLPLVWTNLRQVCDDADFMPRLKGVYRSCWTQSERRLKLTVRLLRAFADNGIPALALKGLPLSLVHYPDPTLRPMSDLDIAVRWGDRSRASTLLERDGFAAIAEVSEGDLLLRHASSYRAAGGEVDLHWHILFECPTEPADMHFWSGAVVFDVRGAGALRPCASDMLLHVIVHGVRWNPVPPMRWIVDSAMLLRSGEPIDWERISRFAIEHRLSLRVGSALHYLRQRFGLPVPDGVVRSLVRSGTWLEQSEFALARREAKMPSVRHARRALHLLRLAPVVERRSLPRAMWGELRRRYFARLRIGSA